MVFTECIIYKWEAPMKFTKDTSRLVEGDECPPPTVEVEFSGPRFEVGDWVDDGRGYGALYVRELRAVSSVWEYLVTTDQYKAPEQGVWVPLDGFRKSPPPTVDVEPEPQPAPALLPCPFCGGGAEVERKGTGRQSCIVRCTDCGCALESNENGAGRRWNTRASNAEPEVVPVLEYSTCRPRNAPAPAEPSQGRAVWAHGTKLYKADYGVRLGAYWCDNGTWTWTTDSRGEFAPTAACMGVSTEAEARSALVAAVRAAGFTVDEPPANPSPPAWVPPVCPAGQVYLDAKGDVCASPLDAGLAVSERYPPPAWPPRIGEIVEVLFGSQWIQAQVSSSPWRSVTDYQEEYVEVARWSISRSNEGKTWRWVYRDLSGYVPPGGSNV